jgi:acyl-CoA synthetase (NDP forming)
VDRAGVRGVIDGALARGGGWLTAAEAQRLLDAVGIATARSRVVGDEAAAVEAARAIGYPVVIKATGPRIVHKTELRAVVVGVQDDTELRAAWADLRLRLGDLMDGALIQEMVIGGVEMLVGAVEDPTFGPVIACASGGTRAEVFGDSEVRLHPLSHADAEAMIDGLQSAALLRGFRGAPPADEPALVDTLLRVTALVGLAPELQELDLNPVLVLPRGVRAVDARVRVEIARPPTVSRRIVY